jgi:hypothetical protein
MDSLQQVGFPHAIGAANADYPALRGKITAPVVSKASQEKFVNPEHHSIYPQT